MKLQPILNGIYSLYVGDPADLVGTGWTIVSNAKTTHPINLGRNVFLQANTVNANTIRESKTRLVGWELDTHSHDHDSAYGSSMWFNENTDVKPTIKNDSGSHAHVPNNTNGWYTADGRFNGLYEDRRASTQAGSNGNNPEYNRSINNLGDLMNYNSTDNSIVFNTSNESNHNHDEDILGRPSGSLYENNDEHQHDLKNVQFDSNTFLGGKCVYLIQYTG